MRRLALLVLIVALAGCQAPASSPSPGAASESTAPSEAAGALPTTCNQIQMLSPNGNEVDLNGTWLGNDGAYWLFTQIGDCLWATASDKYHQAAGNFDIYWQIYLRGTLLADFTIPVEYAYSSLGTVSGPHYGHAVLSLSFSADGNDEMTLRKIAGCTASGVPACPEGEGTLQTTEWTLFDSRAIVPPPVEQ